MLEDLQPPPPSDLPRRLFTAGVLAAWFAVAALPVFATQGVQNEKTRPVTSSVSTQQLIQRQWIPEPSRAMRAWAVPSSAQEVSQPVPYTSAQSFIQRQWPSPETRALPPRYVPSSVLGGDNPPPKSYVHETLTRNQWIPPVLTPTYQTVGYQDEIDRAPLLTRSTDRIILPQWTPPVVTPTYGTVGLQDGLPPPDNPPPKTYVYETITRNQWLTGWEIPIKRHITIQNGVANIFDAPPLRTYGNERILLRQWVPPVVTPTYQTVGFQDAIADTGADNPPPSTRNWLQIIQRQWIPRVPVAEWYTIQIDTSFKIAIDRIDYRTIVQQWEEKIAEQWPRARRAVVTPSGAADPVGDFAPRKSYVNERTTLAQWDTSWVVPKKPNSTIQNGAPDPVITPDNPPPRSQYWVPLIQQQWIPRVPVAEWYSIQIDVTTPPPLPRWRHDIVLRQWEDQAQEIWPKARRPQLIESGPDIPDVFNLVWYYIPQIRKGGRLL